MSKRVIGTCGECGGAVGIPVVWMSIIPPTPSCFSCGAVPENPHGQVMAMKKRPIKGVQDIRVIHSNITLT